MATSYIPARVDVLALIAEAEAMLPTVDALPKRANKEAKQWHAQQTDKRNAVIDLVSKSAISRLALASFDQTKVEASISLLIKQANGQDAARDEYIAGGMAAALYKDAHNGEGSNMTIEGAIGLGRALLKKTGYKEDAKNPDDRRTQEEERLYRRIQGRWITALRDAGLKSEGKNSGNKNAAGSQAGDTGDKKPAVDVFNKEKPVSIRVTPKSKSAKEIHATLQRAATAVFALINGPAFDADKAAVEAFYSAMFPEDAAKDAPTE